jgi:hypothetical protein
VTLVPLAERYRRGVCPLCAAADGEPCRRSAVLAFGRYRGAVEMKPEQVVHVARLSLSSIWR